MKSEVLQELIRSRRPFSLRLTDGSSVPVPHPEFIWLTQDGQTAIVNTEGSRIKILDVDLVTALEAGEGPNRQNKAGHPKRRRA